MYLDCLTDAALNEDAIIFFSNTNFMCKLNP